MCSKLYVHHADTVTCLKGGPAPLRSWAGARPASARRALVVAVERREVDHHGSGHGGAPADMDMSKVARGRSEGGSGRGRGVTAASRCTGDRGGPGTLLKRLRALLRASLRGQSGVLQSSPCVLARRQSEGTPWSPPREQVELRCVVRRSSAGHLLTGNNSLCEVGKVGNRKAQHSRHSMAIAGLGSHMSDGEIVHLLLGAAGWHDLTCIVTMHAYQTSDEVSLHSADYSTCSPSRPSKLLCTGRSHRGRLAGLCGRSPLQPGSVSAFFVASAVERTKPCKSGSTCQGRRQARGRFRAFVAHAQDTPNYRETTLSPCAAAEHKVTESLQLNTAPEPKTTTLPITSNHKHRHTVKLGSVTSQSYSEDSVTTLCR